jgi:hypothetical protein
MSIYTAQASSLKVGVYKMSVNFGQGPEFIDYLNVEDLSMGVFTVPGNFTSRVKLETEDETFSFVLKANEGGRDLIMNFKGRSSDNGVSIQGEIIEPANNSIIGKFKGARLYESRQDCGDYLIPY